MAVDEQPRRAPLGMRRALCPTRLFICPPSAVHRLASCRSGYVRVYAKARFVFKPKPELPFRPVGPSVGEVVRSTPLRAPGLVLAAHGVGWRALRVLPRLVFWPHCVY